MLYRCAQSLAFTRGRDYVSPDDIRELSSAVLSHRIGLDTKTTYSGISKEEVLSDVVGRVKVPV